MSEKEWNPELVVTHLGEESDQYLHAVVPPVFLTSLHVFDNMDAYYNNANSGKERQFVYGRSANPTVEIVEKKVCALEHGEMALAFGSGMAAISSAIVSVCNAGDHIICVRNAYGPTKQFADNYLGKKMNIQLTYVEGGDMGEIEAAVKDNTTLFILESPTSLVFDVVDLRAAAALARQKGIVTIMDNTYCTPIFQNPLDMGIDIVMHTASKYLGGHSDVIGGILVSKNLELMKRIANEERTLFGGILGPMEAWLVLRGLRTLPIRVKAHYESGLKIAEFLDRHPKIRKVHYPALKSHPRHALAMSQQSGCTGLLSIEPDTGVEMSKKFCDSLQWFQTGVSWGGFESLKMMPMLVCGEEEAKQLGGSRNLIRLHVGLEGTDVLLEELDKKLKAL